MCRILHETDLTRSRNTIPVAVRSFCINNTCIEPNPTNINTVSILESARDENAFRDVLVGRCGVEQANERRGH